MTERMNGGMLDKRKFEIIGVTRKPGTRNYKENNLLVRIVTTEEMKVAQDADDMEKYRLSALSKPPPGGKAPARGSKPPPGGLASGGKGSKKRRIDDEDDDEDDEDDEDEHDKDGLDEFDFVEFGWYDYEKFDGRGEDILAAFMKRHLKHVEADWANLTWKYPLICFEGARCAHCASKRAEE